MTLHVKHTITCLRISHNSEPLDLAWFKMLNNIAQMWVIVGMGYRIRGLYQRKDRVSLSAPAYNVWKKTQKSVL